MQPDMQAFRRCQAHAAPRGGDITFKSQDTLANQKPDETWTGDDVSEFTRNIIR